MVEYVRAKESKQKIVSAVRGYVSGTFPNYSFTSDTVSDRGTQIFAAAQPMPIIGASRTPYITETCIYFRPSYGLVFQAEVYLPPNIGLDSLDASDLDLEQTYHYTNAIDGNGEDRWFGLGYDGGVPLPSGTSPRNESTWSIMYGSTLPLNAANRYARIGGRDSHGGDSSFETNASTTFYYGLALAPASDGYAVSSVASTIFWGGAPSSMPASEKTNFRGIGPVHLDSTTVQLPTTSYQVDDPLMGALAENWQLLNSTWNAPNAAVSTLGPGARDLYSLSGHDKFGWRLCRWRTKNGDRCELAHAFSLGLRERGGRYSQCVRAHGFPRRAGICEHRRDELEHQ